MSYAYIHLLYVQNVIFYFSIEVQHQCLSIAFISLLEQFNHTTSAQNETHLLPPLSYLPHLRLSPRPSLLQRSLTKQRTATLSPRSPLTAQFSPPRGSQPP